MLDLVRDKRIEIAIVGASNNPNKYGYKIYKNLTSKDYKVTPVNPNKINIEGVKTIAKVELMNEKPDIIDFVVPPSIALSEAQRLHENGYNNFWFQPGSESDELLEYLTKADLNYLVNECIMVQTK